MMIMAVYLYHFSRPLGNPDNRTGQADHYIGTALVLDRRMAEEQRNGGRVKILQACIREGITWELARTWPDGGRKLERRLKDRGGASRLCPMCGIYPRDGGGTMQAGYSVIAAELNKRFRPQPPITRQQVSAWHMHKSPNMAGERFPGPVAEREHPARTTPRWLFDTGQVTAWFRKGTRGPRRRGWRVWSEYEPEREITDVTTELV